MMSLWYSLYAAAAAAKSLQSCPSLCDLIGGSPPGSAIPEILHARTLEWFAIAFSDSLYECTIIYVINLYLWAFRLLQYFPYKYYSEKHSCNNLCGPLTCFDHYNYYLKFRVLNFSQWHSPPFFFLRKKKPSLAKSIGVRFPDLWELQTRDGKFCLFSEEVFFLVL